MFYGSDTRNENCNRESSLGPMGTRYATNASGTHHTASGCQRVSSRSHATIVQHKKWSAPWCLQVETLGALEKGKPWKKSQVEVESDAESQGSGIGGWKQEVTSALLGLRESMEDQNELLREKNRYLLRIARHL